MEYGVWNMSEKSIRVISGDKWVKSSPQYFWRVEDPCDKDYTLGLINQIRLDGFDEIRVIDFKGWSLISSESDWITVGLENINCNDERELFETMHRFTDEEGRIGTRVEYPLRVFTNNLILWRNGFLSVIKGEVDHELVTFIKKKFQNSTVVAFNNK